MKKEKSKVIFDVDAQLDQKKGPTPFLQVR